LCLVEMEVEEVRQQLETINKQDGNRARSL
jgi:hypothetical protein